jgi:hypothetical protein
MPIIEGGTIIQGGNVIPGAKRQIITLSTFASGAGSDGKTGLAVPAVGQLVFAADTGYLWQRTGANTWVRRDTI